MVIQISNFFVIGKIYNKIIKNIGEKFIIEKNIRNGNISNKSEENMPK